MTPASWIANLCPCTHFELTLGIFYPTSLLVSAIAHIYCWSLDCPLYCWTGINEFAEDQLMDPHSCCPRLLLSSSPRRRPPVAPHGPSQLLAMPTQRFSTPSFFVVCYSPYSLEWCKCCPASWASCNLAVETGLTSDFDQIEILNFAILLSRPLVAHFPP